MTAERWRQIGELFAAARNYAPAEQAAFLARACNGDISLKNEVQALLSEDSAATAESFLTRPCPLRDAFDDQPEFGLRGACLGRYRIEERVGGGGMADVYRAVPIDDLSRRVAIKVIRSGLEDAAAVARFNTERGVLAGLAHPHIVRLLDGGATPQGLPYLVLEYVDGAALDHYCETHQLDNRQRLQLLHRVCLAVAYAHRQHIVHRDLKPANILVTGDGTPYVSDFGLAKHLAGDGGQTQTGQVFGTPSYMAPEQAVGRIRDIGPQTDVYGLGAVLYALLVGRPPFRGATVRETLEQVVSQEPAPPARLQPGLPRELETICLKCLDKEPQRRYADAGALADDLKRFLDGQRIEARPLGRAARFSLWARRNPRVALPALALVAVVLISLVSVTSLWLLARSEQREADRQRARAAENERLAWQAVDDLTRIAEDSLAGEPHMSGVQLDLLEKALTYRQAFIRAKDRDPVVRFKTAQAYHFVARVHNRLAAPVKAEQAVRHQIALLDELIRDFPDESRYRFDLCHAETALQMSLRQQDRQQAVEESLGRSLRIAEELVKAAPDEPRYADALAHQWFLVGGLRANQGELDAAETAYRKALAIAERLVAAHPERREPPAFGCNLQASLHGLAQVYRRRDQDAKARATLGRAIKALEEVVRQFPREPVYRVNLAQIYMEYASLLQGSDGGAEAERLLRRACEIADALARDFVREPGYPFTAVDAHEQLGKMYLASGRALQAHEAFSEAERQLERIVTDFSAMPEASQARLRLQKLRAAAAAL